MVIHDETDRLIDRMVEIIESDRNRKNGEFWEHQPCWARDLWRGLPKFIRTGSVPFIIEPGKFLWSKLADFDFHGYYNDPEEHLKATLKMNIYKFEVFRDNTYFDGEITPWLGWIFEATMFGAHVRWRETEEPIIDTPNVLADHRDLSKLSVPNFFKSGLMPRLHELYEFMQRRVKDRLNVTFPMWVVGVFPLAIHLRGMQRILLDFIDRPQFVHDLFRFIVDAEKSWLEDRAKFTGDPLEPGRIYDDEIGVPVISPSIYRDFIFPYEKEIAEFMGGLVYFHSCNNITKFLPQIKQLPGFRFMHISPWADLLKALEILEPDIALDICLHPLNDVQNASEEDMKEKLRTIRRVCNSRVPISVRADTMRLLKTTNEDLAQILLWRKVAEEELS